jgi:serine/threonine-protein kinase
LEQRFAQVGQYTIEYEVARGGMGTVYRARHSLLRRPTAIKISHSQDDASFHREALLTCALTHPNTVQLYDFGKGEEGTFYLAMEYVEGFHLEELVDIAGPLPAARAVRILMQVAGSLAEAHEHGILHRDIKPRNIMLTERGGVRDFVKVLDLGLARKHTAQLAGMEQPGVFEGTPGYAAPEIVRGGSAEVRSDIFSLGCVAYYLLSGHSAFIKNAGMTATLTSVLNETPAPLPDSVPASLKTVVMCCLEKQARDRPQSMQVIASRLRATLTDCKPWTVQDAEAWWREHPAKEHAKAPDRPEQFSVIRSNAFPPEHSRRQAVGESKTYSKLHGGS